MEQNVDFVAESSEICVDGNGGAYLTAYGYAVSV